MLKIGHKTLRGIIDGTQKRAEISNFQKLAMFLNMPIDEFIDVHSSMTEKKNINSNY